MPLPVEGHGGEIRSNSRYVVPENSDQGTSNEIPTLVMLIL